MKKILVVAIALIASVFIYSCKSSKNKKPELDYAVDGYVQTYDWKYLKSKSDSIISYDVRKKIAVEKKYFPGSTDSITLYVKPENLKNLPNPDTLRNKLFNSLLDSKYSCSHPATFNPQEIKISFTDWEGKDCYWIQIKFLASNSYGTPGELEGHYFYDIKTNKLVTSSVMD
jgi:hypothetical protein